MLPKPQIDETRAAILAEVALERARRPTLSKSERAELGREIQRQIGRPLSSSVPMLREDRDR